MLHCVFYFRGRVLEALCLKIKDGDRFSGRWILIDRGECIIVDYSRVKNGVQYCTVVLTIITIEYVHYDR